MAYDSKEKLNANKQKWRNNNRPKLQEIQKRFETRHPIKVMLKTAKRSAKKRGLEFDLKFEDLTIPERCIYFGWPLTNIRGQGFVATNASLDRIDSKKGYIKGNVQIVSYLANSMKHMSSKEQLIAFAHGVLKLHGTEGL